MIAQISPDADSTQFWYDEIGRVVASQDGRQRDSSFYSYTLYDEQGRIVEVGEKYTNTPLNKTILFEDQEFENWVYSGALVPDRDMGKDGTTGSMATRGVARDAFGYYDGDYTPIGGTTANFELDYTGSDFVANNVSLYNGNIRHIVSQNKKLG